MKKQKFKLIKQIRQVTGTALGITFTKSEINMFGLECGDDADISDMIIIKNKILKWIKLVSYSKKETFIN